MRTVGFHFIVGFTGSCVHAALLALALACFCPRAVSAQCLMISEYVEGSANNKALEIKNSTPAPVDLAASSCRILIYANGAANPTSTVNLTGTIAAGDVYVVVHSGAGALLTALADASSASLSFNGNDAVALVLGDVALDIVGQIGFDPGTEWGTTPVTTRDHTLRRKASVTQGDTNGGDVFDPANEWDAFPMDAFDDLGAPNGGTCAWLAVPDPLIGAATGLSRPTPNPNGGGGESTIDFSLATRGAVRMEVLDLAGRRVRELVNVELPEGAHTARWNGRDDVGRTLEGGVYFVRLQTGGHSYSRKLVRLSR